MSNPLLHLASSSPRRRELLAALGLEFSYAGVAADESALPGETASDMVVRLATNKARIAYDSREHRLPVLGADTIVGLDERVFGKPASMTGVAVIADGELQTAVSMTEVQFREIDPDEADAYWQSGEPAGKAGAYAVQGLGGIFVSAINGSYTGVVGLPVFETVNLLRQAGIELPAMRNHR
jgi:septum formation protein